MPASEMVGHFARDEQARRSDGTEFPCRKMGVQLVFMYHRCVGTIKHCGKIMMTLMAAKTMLFLSPTTADQVMLVSYLRDISAEKGAQALATKKAVAECLDNNHMLSPPEISTSAGQMTGKTERDLESNASQHWAKPRTRRTHTNHSALFGPMEALSWHVLAVVELLAGRTSTVGEYDCPGRGQIVVRYKSSIP